MKVFIPLALIVLSMKIIHSNLPFILLVVYAFLYRPIIDYKRLISRGILKESFWKLYIPIFRIKYFKELYTNL